MENKKIIIIWLANTLLASLFLSLFITNSGLFFWLVLSAVFSLIIYLALLVMKTIFTKTHPTWIKFLLTMILTFSFSVIAPLTFLIKFVARDLVIVVFDLFQSDFIFKFRHLMHFYL